MVAFFHRIRCCRFRIVYKIVAGQKCFRSNRVNIQAVFSQHAIYFFGAGAISIFRRNFDIANNFTVLVVQY